MSVIFFVPFLLLQAAPTPAPAADLGALEQELVGRYGEAQRAQIHTGLAQAHAYWRPEDGDEKAFAELARQSFAGDAATREALFARLDALLPDLDGHYEEMRRALRWQSDLELGPIYPFDEVMAGYDPGAHQADDLFQNRLAFAVLLNFRIVPLQEQLEQGPRWTRRQWAEARLAERFSARVPASVEQALAQVQSQSAQYVAHYNVWAHHVLTADGQRLFPPKLRLLEHWNIRDEIKADYSDAEHGFAKQRLLQKVFEHIVQGTIPAAVIDNPAVDWNIATDAVTPTTDADAPATATAAAPSPAPEADARYAHLLADYRAVKQADPYSPVHPNFIARSFEESRQLPEARVQAMLEEMLGSKEVGEVASLIQKRLERPLEPFDIWYAGFRPRGKYTEAELDAKVRKRYPTAEAYKKDIPRLLQALGFSAEKARYLAAHIAVDPARGSGHAMAPGRKGDLAHLRTRVEPGGMNYKGYNIAIHEMGHNVEQVFSLEEMDDVLLRGVPNNAFTEALAFTFQNRDLELLGLSRPDAQTRALQALDEFWGAYEICGVALVDMRVWHWMYAHPEATAAQLRDATVQIAKDVWNKYYAPVFGQRDVVLLAVYAHMIDSFLYLPDYPIGHFIAYQVEAKMEQVGRVGPEFERMAKTGNIAPDLWMQAAVGAPVGPKALIEAAHKAVQTVH